MSAQKDLPQDLVTTWLAAEDLDLAHFLESDIPANRVIVLSDMVSQIDTELRALREAREKAVQEYRDLEYALLAKVEFSTVPAISGTREVPLDGVEPASETA